MTRGRKSEPLRGRRLAIQPLAASAPVYHGFAVLLDVAVAGFTFGKFSDFDLEPCDAGDAFVVAPDNGRAGLVWEITDKRYFEEIPVQNQTDGESGVFPVAIP
jgi:hypothetical protein